MNTLRIAAVLAIAGPATIATAATLSHDATMHTSPSDFSETVGTLPAGSLISPVLREDLAAAGITELPPGWIAVRHTIAVEGFVRNRDLGKDFAMKPDSPIFAEASESSPTVATVGPKDPVEVGDPSGRFSSAKVRKDQIVFVNSVPPSSRAIASTMPASTTPPMPSPPAMTPTAPATPTAQVGAAQGEPVAPPTAVMAAPRTFEGYLIRTRRILGRGPKLDYQLVDEDNRRIVLVDLSALLVTEPIEFFEGRLVAIYGPGISQEGVTEAIIRVENLRLAR